MMTNEQLVSNVWSYPYVLSDQGVSYGDQIEQITYLLLLKMDHEREELLGEASAVPARWNWSQMANKDGDDLELHYRHTLEALAREDGLITIFRTAQNKLSNSAKLKRVVSLIDKEDPQIGLKLDGKGEIYEGLLERNASAVRSGDESDVLTLIGPRYQTRSKQPRRSDSPMRLTTLRSSPSESPRSFAWHEPEGTGDSGNISVCCY